MLRVKDNERFSANLNDNIGHYHYCRQCIILKVLDLMIKERTVKLRAYPWRLNCPAAAEVRPSGARCFTTVPLRGEREALIAV